MQIIGDQFFLNEWINVQSFCNLPVIVCMVVLRESEWDMEIGSEVYSRALALQLQRIVGTQPTPVFASLRMTEPVLKNPFNPDWNTSDDVIKYSRH